MVRKLRVALLLDSLRRGGTEKHTVRLANALHASGDVDVWIGCLDPTGEFRNAVCIPDDRVLEYPLNAFYRPEGLRQLVRLTRDSAFAGWDVLHGQDFYGNFMGTVAKAARRKARLVVSRRYEVRDESAFQRHAERLGYRMADAVVFNSRSISRRLVSDGRVERRKVTVIPNGIELGPFENSAPDTPTGPASNAPPRIGIVARLALVKDHATLIQAAATLIETWPKLQIVLIGDGEERNALAARAERLGVASNILFEGDQADIVSRLRTLDVGVLTSRNESCPNAILEYMAAGLPIVATSAGGIPDLVRDGIEARLVSPGDSNALAEALRAVISDPEEARRLGAAARERVQEFSVASMVNRTLGLYEELLGTAKAGEAHDGPDPARRSSPSTGSATATSRGQGARAG